MVWLSPSYGGFRRTFKFLFAALVAGSFQAADKCDREYAQVFALREGGNRIAPWPMRISQRAGVTGKSGDG
jgi:hypothetical protein